MTGQQNKKFVSEVKTNLSHTMSYGMLRRPQTAGNWKVGMTPKRPRNNFSSRSSVKKLAENDDESTEATDPALDLTESK